MSLPDKVRTEKDAHRDQEFASKRWVWLPDSKLAFIKGFVVSDEPNGMLKVRCTDGSDRVVPNQSVDKVNPPQFDQAADMAELTHLNEASVVHNLASRYSVDEIYTYSGLFLVAVNPYTHLPLYGDENIAAYKNKQREEVKPHIYSIADLAFRSMLETHESQSVLVTGESGAGKTENTKKVIQYLAAIQSSGTGSGNSTGTFEQQILQANPILEAFGNAQTVRNNNSSRFGKFIRLEFSRSGQIAGASIDWYLLEKSRVIYQNPNERNYHVFYQLLKGAPKDLKKMLMLEDDALESYTYLKSSNFAIDGLDDVHEYKLLTAAFRTLNMSGQDQQAIFRVVAAILHLGNIEVGRESADQGRILNLAQVERVCHLLGLSSAELFTRGLVKPQVKAGREWVTQSRTAEQIRFSIDALAKGLYERLFGHIVDRINLTLDRSNTDKSAFIGVLDIAGFEIFGHNSFEQLCINYTNEKLQQFFNHHMFVLEQEEYTREDIEWKFMDFGHDLQPTIDLIDKANPMGVFSCLDEDCVMPKTTDKSYTDKLAQLWDGKTPKFKLSKLSMGFTLTHYAGDVEYSTEGWLDKNKDPLNENAVKMLAESTEAGVRVLFEKDRSDLTSGSSGKVKRGMFRTVAQRHKEGLNHLMTQLGMTHPHFVRCIIPNHAKKPKQFDGLLVLDQLRCNGVLEGIRIARSGYPNRIPFAEFRQRYEVLVKTMPRGYVEGQRACTLILNQLGLDGDLFKIGLTKVFFKSGVLAVLEEQREATIRGLIVQLQSIARGHLQRVQAQKALRRSQALQTLKASFMVYGQLRQNPWWKLYVRMRPLLLASQDTGEQQIRQTELNKMKKELQEHLSNKEAEEQRRVRAEQELKKLMRELEGERLVAADKEDILRRAQSKTIELEDQLRSAYDELDKLETQCEELIEAKARVESQTELLHQELTRGSELIAALEKDKQDLRAKIATVEADLDSFGSAEERLQSQLKATNSELVGLKSILEERNAKVSELQRRLDESDEEVSAKLLSVTAKHESVSKQASQLAADNKDLRKQLDELRQTSTGYEELVQRKETEIKAGVKQLNKLQDELRATQADHTILQNQHKALDRDLKCRRDEVEKLHEQNIQLQQEAAKCRELLQARLSESEKSAASKKQLDTQLAELTSKLQEQAHALAVDREKFRGEVEAKEKLIATLQQQSQRQASEKDHKLAEVQEEQTRLARELSVTRARVKDSKKLDLELQTLRLKLTKSEAARQDAEANVRSLHGRIGEVEKVAAASVEATYSEKNALQEELNTLKRDMQQVQQERDLLIQEKRGQMQDVESAKRQLEAAEAQNKKLQKEVASKQIQMDKLRDSVETQVEAKIARAVQDRDAVVLREKKLVDQLAELRTEHDVVVLHKNKLSREIEDLSHDVAREKRAALASDKARAELQSQLNMLKDKNEKERQARSETDVAKRKAAMALEQAQKELKEKSEQLATLKRVLNPKSPTATKDLVDLGKMLHESEKKRKDAEDARALLEAQLEDAKSRWSKDLDEKDSKYYAAKRALLDGLAGVSEGSRSPLMASSNSRLNVALDPSPVVKSRELGDEPGQENIETKDKTAEELEQLLQTVQASKSDLLSVYHDTSKSLVKTKEALAEALQEKRRLERALANANGNDGGSGTSDSQELRLHLEAEISRNEDLRQSIALYKSRADEYFSRLETAETIVLKATRAESFAKSQCREAEDALAALQADIKQSEKTASSLQVQVHQLEGELEDRTIDLQHAQDLQRRAQVELDRIKAAQSTDSKEFAASFQAMRGRYSEEIRSLASDLERERQLTAELKRQVHKAASTVSNEGSSDTGSGPWSKVKQDLENQLRELSQAHEESSLAYQDAQKRIGSLLSQVRTLRATMDDITGDRDQLQTDKRTLEKRLGEMSKRMEELAVAKPRSAPVGSPSLKASSPSLSSSSSLQAQLTQATSLVKLEQQRLTDLQKERDALSREKKTLSLKIVDLEARLLGPRAVDETKALKERVAQLEAQISDHTQRMSQESRQVRTTDRSVKDLYAQLGSKDKHIQRLEEDVARAEARYVRLKDNVEAVQTAESQHQLAARRAEREARDAKERALRLEKELEDWRSRFDALNRGPSFV